VIPSKKDEKKKTKNKKKKEKTKKKKKNILSPEEKKQNFSKSKSAKGEIRRTGAGFKEHQRDIERGGGHPKEVRRRGLFSADKRWGGGTILRNGVMRKET